MAIYRTNMWKMHWPWIFGLSTALNGLRTGCFPEPNMAHPLADIVDTCLMVTEWNVIGEND